MAKIRGYIGPDQPTIPTGTLPSGIQGNPLASWCDYCERSDHDTSACPITDHDHYDRTYGS